MNTAIPDQLEGPWLGYEDAAKRIGLSHAYLRQLVMRKEIDCYRKIGKRVLFSVPGLDAWVNRNGLAA